MDVMCPKCGKVMEYQSQDTFKCHACLQSHCRQAYCPDCNKPLQKLQGCGATDYFCQNGHGLISKKRVIWKFIN